MRLLTGALALLLAACQPQDPNGTPAPPPADAPPVAAAAAPAQAGTVMDLSQPLLARGNEPFWAVRIEGTRLTLMQPGVPEVVYTAPGAQITPGTPQSSTMATNPHLTISVFIHEVTRSFTNSAYR